MNFINSEQAERTRLFDTFRETAKAALSNEEVAERLGPVALELLAINEQAVLPDVRHGLVSLPPGRNELRLPVLPVLATDGTLQPSHTLMLPTKINIGYASLAIQQGRPLQATEISDAFRRADTELKQRHVNPINPQVHSVHAMVRGTPILGRPLLALPPGQASKPPLKQQVDAVHELMHGKDHIYQLGDPKLLTHAYARSWLEIRGHVAGAMPMVAAYENDSIDSDYIWEHFGRTATVLSETRDLDMEPQDILSDAFTCDEQNPQFEEMTFRMIEQGIIPFPGAD